MNYIRGMHAEPGMPGEPVAQTNSTDHSIINILSNGVDGKYEDGQDPTMIPENSYTSPYPAESQEYELGDYHEDIGVFDRDLALMDAKSFNQFLKKKGIKKKSTRDKELRDHKRKLKNRGEILIQISIMRFFC